MENSLGQESSFNEFDEARDMEDEEEINNKFETELSMPPSEPEKLFVEAVRKLSRYEHSLETLVKRFDKHGIQTSSDAAERLRNSSTYAKEAPGRTDLSAGGNHSAFRRQCQTLDSETAERFRNSEAYEEATGRTYRSAGGSNIASRRRCQTLDSERAERFQNSEAYEEATGRTDRSAGGNNIASRRRCQTLDSETAERFRNSNIHAGETLRRTHLLARGNLSASRRQCQTSDDHQKYIKIQIPYNTAKILLRILDEELNYFHRYALKRAESLLSRAGGNLVTVKSLLQSHLENSGRFHDEILMEANEITNDMFMILNKLNEKLVECQVQNLSELLGRSMKDEARLSLLAKRTQARNDEVENIKFMLSEERSKTFYFIIFYFVAIYLIVRLVMLYHERENAFIEKAYLSEWQPNTEEIKSGLD